MGAKRIFCKGCGKYLGEIRDATLRKEITYLCSSCEIKRFASDLSRKSGGNLEGMKDYEAIDFFKNIFSEK